jgi:hypothetical protein
MIEVVAVVVVRQQDHIDRTDVLGGDRRTGELARARAPTEPIAPPGRVECRVGQDPPAGDLEEDGRAADVREPDLRHDRLGVDACSTAHSRARSATFSHPS